MKRLLFYLFLLLSVTMLQAQEDFEKVKIEILPESTLIIAGSTNVNKFDCRFNNDLISKSITVSYVQREIRLKFSDFDLKFLTDGFDCGNRRMNSDFQDLLVAEHYPDIVISVDKIELVSSEYVKAFITVQIAGNENCYEFPVQTGNDRFEGKFKINIRDFNIEPPKKALGLIEVDEMIEVQFNLKIKR